MIKYFNKILFIFVLSIPAFLFLNRFLIPDISCDSLNYHLYFGYKGINPENNKFEFYPTGIHNFSTILDIPGYLMSIVFGYRLGSITSLIFLYLTIFVSFKIYRLFIKNDKFLHVWWWVILFSNIFISFETFLQIGTYYADIQVLFLMVASLYSLLLYERKRKFYLLILISLINSFLIVGKMTSWYFFPFFYVYLFLLVVKEKDKRLILKNLFVLIVIPLFFSTNWFLNNFRNTGNPVFPFYNSIFLSKYFVENDFSQVIFGGRNLMEKLFWGIFSIKDYVRLGEVHDLFNDYRINIFFISSIVIFVWSLLKKEEKLLKFVALYLGTYLCWSITFGYLRYGLILEFWGGLILLLWLVKIKNSKYFLFIVLPLVVLFVYLDKKIINMSLAYDISFRPGYFYNKSTYLNEIVNLFTNKIKINEDTEVDVFLNCSVPNMSYYVLSKYNKLPVINIDNVVYGSMVGNLNYRNEVTRRLKIKYPNKNILNFVAITTESGLNVEYESCIKNIKNAKFEIKKEIEGEFIGLKSQKLKIIFGTFEIDNYFN